MKRILTLLIPLALLACQPTEKQQETETKDAVSSLPEVDYTQYPDLLVKALKAHGGLDMWQSYGALNFDKVSEDGKRETHTTNLYNRMALIDRDTAKIGFDGEQVWVSPNLAAFGKGSARFYHNLYFYFVGMPFLLSDPGIIYEDQGTKSIDDKLYRVLKISYNNGVGDSDQDEYIAYFNPETFQLELLLYTVTYHSGEASDAFHAMAYNNWQEVDGLLMPISLEGFVYEDGSLGKKRFSATLENISFAKETPDSTLFEQPENSEIDSLKIK